MDAATVHILNNEQVYNELRPDMRTSPDIMTEREAAAYAEAEEGASSQMDRDVNDFLDSVFAGLDENIAVNERRDAMAAPYVQQLTGAGYTEKQAGHLARFLVANAEIMGAVHGVSPETFLAENFGGIAETTPEMFSMTLAEWEGKMRRQMARAPLAERDPLLAAVRGRIDPASIKAYDPQGAGELVRKYGGLFRSKDKGGLPLDVVADGLVRDGLLPEGSGANELLAALQDRREKTFFQPVNEDVDPGKAVPVIAAETESAPVWQSMKGRERKAIVNAIAGDILNEATGEIISLSRKNAAHLISSATSRGVGGPAHIAAVRNVQELLRVAERIESYPDRKNQEDVQVVHRFFARRQMARAPLAERDPLLAAVRGRIDPASIKAYDPQGTEELTRKYGRGLFLGKNKGGLALDVVADGLVRDGLLPEGSGANELLAALQDRREKAFFQPSREKIRLAEEALHRDVEAWGRTVDSVVAAGEVSRPPVMLTQTPLILHLLGADFREVLAAPHMFDGARGKKAGHPAMTADMLKQIPTAMADPIAVFGSATVPGRLVFMLDIKDSNGATVVVPVELNASKDHTGRTVHVVTTAYSKENNGVPNDAWFAKQAKNARYINTIKEKRWVAASGSDSLWGASNASGKKIYTDADLVKLREANPALYQSVYHGSPYRFDEFDLEHIGRGEGAQAFGWGLYFTGSKEIAEWYRRKLSTSSTVLIDGEAWELTNEGWTKTEQGWVLDSPSEVLAANAINEFSESRDAIESLEAKRDIEGSDVVDEAISFIEDGIIQKGESGQLYEVDIPEDNTMLDLDKPLAGQSELVQDKLKNILQSLPEDALENLGGDINLLLDPESTGKDFYGTLTSIVGGPERASRLLNSIGIKGNKYLDGTSRSSGEGSHNYVIFDDSAIEILNTYYQDGDTNARGAYDPLTKMIFLFKGKHNFSTVIHEAAHYFLDNLIAATKLDTAPAWVRESWNSVLEAYEVPGIDLDATALPDTAPAWLKKDFSALERQQGAGRVQVLTAVHERFAREFEAYARDGKAPSSRLQSAFNQFSNWLNRLYREVRSLIGADAVSPEISKVFDRLLATEQEIEAAQKEGVSPVSLTDMEAQGLEVDPSLKDRYARAVEEARTRAEAVIAARRMVEQRKQEKEFRREAEARIAADAFYSAETAVRERGGINWDSVLDVLDEDLAADLRRKWSAPFTKGLFKEAGALHIIDVCADFNVDTPQNLAGLLLSTPTRLEAIRAEVQASLDEWNRTFDGSLEYSNALDEALAIEMEALTGEAQLSGARLRAELDRRMGVKKSSAVDAEYKALKDSLRKQDAVLRGVMREFRNETKEMRNQNRERLAELKQQERAKRAALAAAYRARIEREKITRQIRKDAISKSVNDAFRQQILALVAHWRKLGTGRMVPRDADGMPSLREFVKQNESLFGEQEGLFPDWLMAEDNTVGAKSSGDLSLEELRDLGRAIKILAHQGRNHDRLLSFGKKVQLTEAAGEMIASMNKMAGTKRLSARERATFQGQILGMLRGAMSSLTVMRYLFDALDGYVDTGGPDAKTGAGHKYIVSRLQDASGREQGLIRKYSAKVTIALTKLARPDMHKGFVIDGVALPEDVSREWGGMFTHEQVLTVALNMGNEGNLTALMKGYNWSEADLQRITSRLTVAELQAVQELWDIINELYPLLDETHRTLNG